jgi:hypothetical protein
VHRHLLLRLEHLSSFIHSLYLVLYPPQARFASPLFVFLAIVLVRFSAFFFQKS